MHSTVHSRAPMHGARTPSRAGMMLSSVLLALMLPPALSAQVDRGYERVYEERDGRRIYMDRCAECHMPDGRGRGDGSNGFPPLTGMSEWFALPEGKLYVAHAIVFGPYGEVMVGDQFYYGMMPRFGPRFDDQQIVAVIRFIAEELNTPAPGYEPIDIETVKAARRLTDRMDVLVNERYDLPPR